MEEDIFSFINDEMMDEDIIEDDLHEDSLGEGFDNNTGGNLSEPIWNKPENVEESNDPESPFFGRNDYDGDGIPNQFDHTMGAKADEASEIGNEIEEEFEEEEMNTELEESSDFENNDEITLENEIDEEFIGEDMDSEFEPLNSENDIESEESSSNFYHPGDHYHTQQASDTCAVAVQTDALKDFDKIDENITEEQMTEFAEQEGYYEPGVGTTRADMGKLLSEYGVNLEENRINHSMEDLIYAKAEGEKVLIGLDGVEIWNQPDHILDELDILDKPSAGHAVEFKGVIDNDSGQKQVVLDDPGIENGRNIKIPLHDFIDAWQDFNNFAVITDVN